MFSRICLIICVSVLWPGVAAIAAPWPSPTGFTRLVEQPAGQERLETAIVRYSGPRGLQVDLVAAIHIGDAAYYSDLQRQFSQYHKLLFELVKPADLDVATAGQSKGGLSALQRWLKDLLHLDFQLDAIDYARPNFVHADIGSDELAANLRDDFAAIAGMVLRWTLMDSARVRRADGSLRLAEFDLLAALGQADRPRALKLALARELLDMDDVMGELGAANGPGAILIARRNQVALGVLRQTIAKGARHIGIFYGAAHLPDLDAHLRADFGLKRGSVRWLRAWDLAPQAVPR